MPATFTVTSIRQEAGVGDRLRRCRRASTRTTRRTRRPAPIAGQIVSIYGDALTAGQNQIVALNRGAARRHRARPRAGALARRQGRARPDRRPTRAPTIKLPDERHGMLFVFRVFERMSYALILSVQDPVKPGDRFTPALTLRSPSTPAPRPGMIDRDELAAWLRLLDTPGVGRDAARRLLGRLRLAAGGARRLDRGAQQLVGAGRGAAPWRPSRRDFDALLDATLAWLARRAGRRRATCHARRPALPAVAAQTADPPLLLYVAGPARAAARRAHRGGRQPQPDAAGPGQRARLRRAPEPGRADGRVRAGARHRRRGARGRAGRAPRQRPSPWSAPGSTASTRHATARSRTASPRTACWSASTRSARRRCRRTSRSATASSPA